MEKKACSMNFNNTRDLVNFLNKNNIEKEDIVAVLDMMATTGQLFLIYYD